jgi:hypothetical protein
MVRSTEADRTDCRRGSFEVLKRELRPYRTIGLQQPLWTMYNQD